ncbi:MAG TPA: NUDIX domain-containing protein [Micromonosporaceae bacterium]|nr:NUDIX domain-containing protein [Micromonosporaceae bacterium]
MATIEQRLTVDYPVEILRPPNGGLLPGSMLAKKPSGGKVPRAQLRAVAAEFVRALLRGDDIDDIDDDPIGELDDDTLILLQAMAELDEESDAEGRAFNPALHKRYPKGHPLGGKFRPMVDLFKEAILKFDPKRDRHPFESFSRPQLLNAAKARGITLKKGEDRDSIAAKLLADLGGKPAPTAVKKAAAPAKKAAPNAVPEATDLDAVPPVGVTTKDGKTRYSDPDGVPGLLRPASDPGESGDGHITKTDGSKGPWGKFGAAGVLLRHRGADGVDRYLLVARGEGLSQAGKWQLPGGALDSKENPFQGATREIIEELGFQAGDVAQGRVHGFHESEVPDTGGWKYTSIAATVPKQLEPDLSGENAQFETGDAKWMTIDEIRQLDKDGKLLDPLAGGKLESQVLDLFPKKATSASNKAAKQKSAPPAKKPSTAADVEAGDFSGLKRVGPQAGSNAGGMFEAPDGSRWYVKAQQSEAHAKNEATASALYREAGIDVPAVHRGRGLAELGDGPQTATRIIDGAKSDLSSKLGDAGYVAKVRHGFAVDAWLANWDAVGLSMDNIVTADGKPHRVDVGGSLLFRAQGAPKGDAFGKSVLEWSTLRDPSKAPQAAQFFADITPEQLQSSAKLVEKIKPARIKQIVDDPDLAQLLIDRRKDLLARAKKVQVPDFDARIAKSAAREKALDSARIRLESIGFAGALFGDLPSHWTPDEAQNTAEALSDYRSIGYIALNNSLRGLGPSDSTTIWHTESIDRGMLASRLEQDVVVYRGIKFPDTVFGSAWTDSGSKVGLSWTDPAYTSTTADRQVAASQDFTEENIESALMRLIVPSGVGAIRLSDIAPPDRQHLSVSEEAELLLQRGLTFRVVADYGYDGTTKKRILDVEVVPV